MRSLPLVIFALLAGCAGNVADYVGPRASIVSPQLIRYGLTLDQSRCVGGKLGASLTPLQLRKLTRLATAVRKGAADPSRLTIQDLVRVAGRMDPPAVKTELERASLDCGVATAPSPAIALPMPAPAGPSGPAARTPAWLNLGAAGSGQLIAIDAASIEQEASIRTAWFRLTEPGSAVPGQNTYQLRIDCSSRMISEKARRKPDGTGATVEVPGDDKPVPIERGTVMEIAHLALCT